MVIKSAFSNNLKKLRFSHNLTLQQLADAIGVTKGSISQWENGISLPSAESICKLAEYFNEEECDFLNLIMMDTNDHYINTEDNSVAKKKLPNNAVELKKVKIPILGKIACGQPIFAEESFESFVSVSEDIHADFGLWAQGDSMIDARINDGDLVFIRQQEMVENGEIAAVLINDEATLKRVYYDEQNSTITLISANSKYPPFVYHNEELNNIRILGKAVYFLSVVR